MKCKHGKQKKGRKYQEEKTIYLLPKVKKSLLSLILDLEVFN